jgi:hypothetical protein
MALTTLAECKAYIGIAPSDTAQDAIIEIIRPAIEELILAFCDTDFEQKTVVKEMHDGIQADTVVPYNYPITSIDGVWMDTDANGDNGVELEAGTDYFVDDDGSVILVNRVTPFRRGSVKLAYKHGYTSVPATVKLCVYQCVKAELQRRKRNTEDITSRGKEGESESYGAAWDKKTGLPAQIMSKLESFRTKEFPSAGMAQRNT